MTVEISDDEMTDGGAMDNGEAVYDKFLCDDGSLPNTNTNIMDLLAGESSLPAAQKVDDMGRTEDVVVFDLETGSSFILPASSESHKHDEERCGIETLSTDSFDHDEQLNVTTISDGEEQQKSYMHCMDTDSDPAVEGQALSDVVSLGSVTVKRELRFDAGDMELSVTPLSADINDHLKPVVCVICGAAFRTVSLLLNHLNTHHSKTNSINSPKFSHNGGDCDKEVSKTAQTAVKQGNAGLRSSTKHKMAVCVLCQDEFSTVRELFSHLKTTHADLVNAVENSISLPKRQSKPTMGKHVRVASPTPLLPAPPPQSSYVCKICSKVYTSQEVFVRHISAHRNRTRSHTCHTCLRSFQSHHDLANHMTIHTRNKKNRRQLCPKSSTKRCWE